MQLILQHMGNHEMLNQFFMVEIKEVEVMGGSTLIDDDIGVTQLKEALSKQHDSQILRKKHKNLWMHICIYIWWKKCANNS